MAFVDDITLHLKAGRGGDGVVRWLHEKFKEFSGPCGGDGGKGGDVYALAIRDIGILASYRTVKEFKAEKGGNGETRSRTGRGGEDLILRVPVGSKMTNTKTGEQFELLSEGEKVLILRGGRGGLGNERFKSSTNQTPEQSTPGTKGEEASFRIEVRLIADVGLVGLPNAGKSSLLVAITRSNAKVGNYAFTTLEPNLGDYYGHIIADIPGLIEGASEGRGLGNKFLRHVSRTNLVVHCISLEQDDLMGTYKTVRKELESYTGDIAEKPEIILLTKADLVEKSVSESAVKLFKNLKKPVYVISIYDDSSLKRFGAGLVKHLKELV